MISMLITAATLLFAALFALSHLQKAPTLTPPATNTPISSSATANTSPDSSTSAYLQSPATIHANPALALDIARNLSKSSSTLPTDPSLEDLPANSPPTTSN